MTPAVTALKRAGAAFTLHQYEHDPACSEYGREAADKLGVTAERVFKTLVASLDDGRLVVAVVPVSGQLDLKLLAKVYGVKKAALAQRQEAERATGYVVGGVSPLGQKRRLAAVLDASARDHETIFVSGGRRGLDIELSGLTLARLLGASFASIGKPART